MSSVKWCKHCGKHKVIYSGYPKSIKSYKCLECEHTYTPKELGIKSKNNKIIFNNPERVKFLTKALMTHCKELMKKRRNV